MSTVETTIKDVLGVLPFMGTDGLVLGADTTRPAVRTWLQRQGWKGDVVVNLTLDELRDAYSDAAKLDALANAKGVSPTSRDRSDAVAHAEAPYAPRNAKLLAYLASKGINGTARQSSLPVDTAGFPPYVPPTIPTPRATAKTTKTETSDDAAQLAAILARMTAANAAPLDEARVVELIKTHGTAETIVRHEVTITNGAAAVTITGQQHPKLGTLAKAMAARMTNGFAPNIWIFGPTASGKTHAAEQVSEAMGRTFYMHGSMSMVHELMGFVDAAGNYHRTPFRDAFENGGVCLLDECDSYDPQVTLAPGAALSNGQCAFPDGMVKRHPDSIFLAAGNTIGTGPTAEFVGRNRLDAMFLSRFAVKIEWPRDPQIELAIAGNPSWVMRVTKARDRAAAAGIKHIIDPRHSQAGAALIAAGMTSDEAAEITYLSGLTDAQRRTVEA